MAWTQKESGQTATGPHVARPSSIVFSEETLNDSDKELDIGSLLTTFSVVKVLGVRIEFTATATVGTRQFTLQSRDDDDDVIYAINLNASTDTAASASVTIEMLPGIAYAAGIDGSPEIEFLPPDFWLGPKHKLRFFDRNAIDAAADDMILHVRGLLY